MTVLAAQAVRAAERDARKSEIKDIATYLQGHVGQKITAYLSGLNDPKMVGKWAHGRVMPRDSAKLRLRYGYQAVRMLVEAYGDETAKAWLFGANSRLDDRAPASVLRTAVDPDDVELVVPAARAFAGGAD